MNHVVLMLRLNEQNETLCVFYMRRNWCCSLPTKSRITDVPCLWWSDV